MKFYAACGFLLAATASAGRPSVTMTVRDGSFAGLDGLDPTLKWSTDIPSSSLDISTGCDIALRPTSDLASLPRSVWGSVSGSVGKWDLGLMGSMSRDDVRNVVLTGVATSDADDITLSANGSLGEASSLDTLVASKTFIRNGARVRVSPLLTVKSRDVDVNVNVELGRTVVNVAASKADQTVSVEQALDAANTIEPSYSVATNKFAVTWNRLLGKGSSLATTLRPNESLDVKWNEDGWVADLSVPIQGGKFGDIDVKIKKEVTF